MTPYYQQVKRNTRLLASEALCATDSAMTTPAVGGDLTLLIWNNVFS
jgi:hypothetical protein